MPEDRPGTVLGGKYELIERFAEGGMAVVWRAVTRGAEDFRQTVAVKRIRAGFEAMPQFIDMFVEEARVGTQLRHPNIVQVHDFGVDERGDHYLVTEWIDGMHLGDYLRLHAQAGRPAPWQPLCAVAVEVLRALHVAHTRRDKNGNPSPILHRDVTPENVLLDVHGIVKLADFGLARARDRTGGRATQPDMVKGKLSYLAPEMVLGVGPSPQSDVFSLGIVLWEAFTHERLFDAPTDPEVIQKVREARVPMISTKRPDIPLALGRIVHRALEREPERRYPSARAMLDAMLEALRVVPVSLQGAFLAQAFAEARGLVKATT